MAEQQRAAADARPDGRPIAVVDAQQRVTLDPALTQESTALVPHIAAPSSVQRASVITFDAERYKILTDTIMVGATPAQIDFFKLVCTRTGLDPFARQIHAVKRTVSVKQGSKWIKEDRWSFQVAIDGFRLIAERTGKYRGQDVPLFCGDDAVWREVWLSGTPPRAAKVGVLRSDFDQPLYAIALWDEYVQTKEEYVENEQGERVKSGKQSPAAMWAKMPVVMLSKVAEALALRKAFPQELSGIYTDDEMGQADNATRDDDDDANSARARRAASSRTHAGATAAGGSNAPAKAAPNFTNGSAIVFPYGPLRQNSVTLDATYNAGATRPRKVKDAPDQLIECGGEFVVSDKRLLEAVEWVDGKLKKHQELEANGQTSGEHWLDDDDMTRLIEWADDLRAEMKRRASVLNDAAQAAARDELASASAAAANPQTSTSTQSATTSTTSSDAPSGTTPATSANASTDARSQSTTNSDATQTPTSTTRATASPTSTSASKPSTAAKRSAKSAEPKGEYTTEKDDKLPF